MVPTDGPSAELVRVFAELGVLLLLFEIGLETDLKEMFRVGPASLAVAAVGVAVPFALGYVYWVLLPASGDSQRRPRDRRHLHRRDPDRDLGRYHRPRALRPGPDVHAEARIIIGAAVIDDVLGLVILSVVSGLAAGAAVSLLGIVRTLAVAVGFLAVAVVIGRFLMPRLLEFVVRLQVRNVLIVFAVAFALGLAALASLAGSALIIGAFAAGSFSPGPISSTPSSTRSSRSAPSSRRSSS